MVRDSILVNAAGLGGIRTKNWKRNIISIVRKQHPKLNLHQCPRTRSSGCRAPSGRFGMPVEIAAIVVFLVSATNGFITGDTIEASGKADRPVAH